MLVSSANRDVLRHLAEQVAAIAALPVQRQKIALWKANNALKPIRPMVAIDQLPWHEMDVDDELKLRTDDPFCQRLETELRRILYRWKHMPADMVVEDEITIPKVIHSTWFGIDIEQDLAVLDPANDVVGHRYFDQLKTDKDLERISAPRAWLDEKATALTEQKAHEIFDGILKVRMQGMLPWVAGWDIITQLHTPENTLLDLVDRPEFMHRMIARIMDAAMQMLDQLERDGLLGHSQSWIHCTGAFNDELPADGFDPQRPRSRDNWTFGMAQIFVSVSPAMHDEFEARYMIPWYQRWGLVYYGCCEPLDDRIDVVRKLPNVRKISQSPWVNVQRGARAIGRDYVFSRKPSPALLAVDQWDPGAVERHLRETIDACAEHGCPLELIQKDISTVRYQPQRLWEWEKIAMRLVER